MIGMNLQFFGGGSSGGRFPGTGGSGEPLPNFANAQIDANKLVNYALNPSHPVGGNKARVFESALGYNQTNATHMIAQIRQQLPNSRAVPGVRDQYGQRFTVDMPIAGPNGNTVTIRTGWIIEIGSIIPRLTTTYVYGR